MAAATDTRGIVTLDPHQICPTSGLRDRLAGADGEDFASLKASIARDGQDQPIGVRRAPAGADHTYPYEVVYGRRRLAAVLALATESPGCWKIRAMVLEMNEAGANLAQLRENAHRSNYSFSEKMKLAADLERQGVAKQDIGAALNLGRTEVSRSLSLFRVLGPRLVEEIGRAPELGRTSWTRLAQSIDREAAGLSAEEREDLLGTRRHLARDAVAECWSRHGNDPRRAVNAAVAALSEKSTEPHVVSETASRLAEQLEPRFEDGRIFIDCFVGDDLRARKLVELALAKVRDEVRRKMSELA
ncbi:ParB/RepB/Spo0J family partition protein [Tranquillimonas alkanivorans]|uniref:ParB/RepB/Spo0J family partition protein n=1 Tax=Tranquillimonas alkanivorans TaxID=441119 RepID=UPI001C4335D3|nr:ParB/RepB/Spo0J family partition protein [Tranquillimonas alkanivorans]